MPSVRSSPSGCSRNDRQPALGSAHLECNSLTELLELRRATEPKDPLDDAAMAVEQHGVGQPAVMVQLLHATPPDEDGKWRLKLADEREHLTAVHVVRHGGDLEVLPVELAVQLRHIRELLATGTAPRGPEVHERHGSGEPGERNGVALQVGERERGSERLAC